MASIGSENRMLRGGEDAGSDGVRGRVTSGWLAGVDCVNTMVQRDRLAMSPGGALRTRGFTLVELLAVVILMAILGSLLSVALNRGKARADQFSCLNNLRQLQTAWVLYAEDDADDALVLNQSESSADDRLFGRRNTADSWVVGSPKEDTTTVNIEKGTLFPYVKSASLYRCASDFGKLPLHGQVRRTRSYSMSAYLNGDAAGLDARVKTKLGEVESQPAARVFVFLEEDAASPWLGSFAVPPREQPGSMNLAALSIPGAWHQGGGNIAFGDGHVEHWRWIAAKNVGRASAGVTLQNYTNWRRLQDAVPRP
jgi:prepilin-type processing-associated H-X9-DG protein/prepilin-type N-terminal cleavage/methylation domain-containing protein